jgi:hypothetical protein
MRSLASFFFLSLCLSSASAQQDDTGKYVSPAQHPNTPNQSSQAPASSAQSASAQNQAISAAPTGFVLLNGTPVKLRINRTVSSADAHVGDTVDFEVLEEVLVSGTIILPKGGTAFATVTDAQAKRRMARGGKLDINIDYVRLVDEEKATLRAVKEVQGGGHTGAMTGAIAATSLVFFPAAPFFLFMHGKDITIPKGTELTAYVNGDLKLDITKFQPLQSAPAVASVVATTAAAPTGQAQMQVTSAPEVADIEIDGIFVGDTPSAVGVASGQHQITVRKTGFKPWERKIAVSSGQVTVNAVLEPDPK